MAGGSFVAFARGNRWQGGFAQSAGVATAKGLRIGFCFAVILEEVWRSRGFIAVAFMLSFKPSHPLTVLLKIYFYLMPAQIFFFLMLAYSF